MTISVLERSEYAPYSISTNHHRFGLSKSVIRTSVGDVTTFHGRSTGSPVAMILLHGAAGSWSTWSPLLTAAEESGVSLDDLIIPDLPGFGESPMPTKTRDGAIEAVSEAVSQVAHSLGYTRWILVGHSLGGFVALDLAATNPQAAEEVLLVSPTTFSVIDSARRPIRRLSVLPAYVGMLFAMRVLSAFGGRTVPIAASLSGSSLFRKLMNPFFAHGSLIDSTVLRALAVGARPESFALASKHAAEYDAEASWSRIRCPVRSLNGTGDIFTNHTDEVALRQVIFHYTGESLPGVGHFAHIERPHAVLRRLFASRD